MCVLVCGCLCDAVWFVFWFSVFVNDCLKCLRHLSVTQCVIVHVFVCCLFVCVRVIISCLCRVIESCCVVWFGLFLCVLFVVCVWFV